MNCKRVLASAGTFLYDATSLISQIILFFLEKKAFQMLAGWCTMFSIQL